MSIGDKIHVLGGCDNDVIIIVNYHQQKVYDISTQEWTQLPDVNEKRWGCTVTILGNSIYCYN